MDWTLVKLSQRAFSHFYKLNSNPVERKDGPWMMYLTLDLNWLQKKKNGVHTTHNFISCSLCTPYIDTISIIILDQYLDSSKIIDIHWQRKMIFESNRTCLSQKSSFVDEPTSIANRAHSEAWLIHCYNGI